MLILNLVAKIVPRKFCFFSSISGIILIFAAKDIVYELLYYQHKSQQFVAFEKF